MAQTLSVSLGIILGAAVILYWHALGRRLADTTFWPAFHQLSRRISGGQLPDDFFAAYARLLRLLAVYLARTGCRVAITILPVVLVVVALGPVANHYAAEQADRLCVYPVQPMTIDIGGQSVRFDGTGTSFQPGGVPTGPTSLVTEPVPLVDFDGMLAVSSSPWTTLGLQLLGLPAQTVDRGPSLLILRASNGTTNPLWPYLGNLEFWFWSSMIGSSLLAGGLISIRAKQSSPEHSDAGEAHDSFDVPRSMHLLSGCVVRFPGLWKKLGNLESQVLTHQLAEVRIDRPIYVTGLARAGTTILLEMLASHSDVATHQYRDFPLLFTPYWWGAAQPRSRTPELPVERSHGDGLFVTRESPEAMEEMLWMAFFKDAHNPDVTQVLEGDDSADDFAAFYRGHIRKLLFLRHGRRYVAKGNYNMTRIPWLAKQFDDARFVVPIRHPVQHIASLMKQHRLFCEAERQFPRALEYMRRVGHFEFGLDCRPINVGNTAVVQQIRDLWEHGDAVRGWARYWAALYGWVGRRITPDADLSERVLVLRFEDLCDDPATQIDLLLNHCRLDVTPQVAAWKQQIAAPRYYQPRFSPEELAAIEEETATVARKFGYNFADEAAPSRATFAALES
jgi:Sulfotransferase family